MKDKPVPATEEQRRCAIVSQRGSYHNFPEGEDTCYCGMMRNITVSGSVGVPPTDAPITQQERPDVATVIRALLRFEMRHGSPVCLATDTIGCVCGMIDARNAARALRDAPDPLREIAEELMRLYKWRCEVGGAITDAEARKYGREKKAAWQRLDECLKGTR